jgi:hypothetical protein
MNRHLKKFVEDANKAHPYSTTKAVSRVLAEIATVEINHPKTAANMRNDLVEEGIKHVLDQERARKKSDEKTYHAPVNTASEIPAIEPRPANAPSNISGRVAAAKNILTRLMIGKGSNRKCLGDCTTTDLDREIGIENGIMDGHVRNVTFYETISKRLKGKPRTKVSTVWDPEEVEAEKADIWEKSDEAA